MPEYKEKIQDVGKQIAAETAASLIEDGMLVGLGTGTTSERFLLCLAKRCQDEGLKIQAVATSDKIANMAKSLNIDVLDIDAIKQIDIDVDGADEIDPQRRLIKGGGGALLREKIVASNSREMIVIVDDSKLVPALGKFPLPVEIIPYGYTLTLKKIELLGYLPVMRKKSDGTLFITDNHGYIADLHFDHLMQDPEWVHDQLIAIPGVVETGLFIDLAGRVIVGFANGNVEILT
jgi:ribose 5-phosphate isomerase A